MQPTKWDSEAKRTRKRLSKREKIAYLQYYEIQIAEGRNRERILGKLAKKIGVSSQRQVERILSQAKGYEQDIKQHYAELSKTTLTLASNFEDYLKYFGNDFDGPVGYVIYGGPLPDDFHDMLTPEMRKLDKRLAINLFYHLKEEFPELANISDWTQLTSDKISHDFIVRLKLKANRGDFTGSKCPACPTANPRLLR